MAGAILGSILIIVLGFLSSLQEPTLRDAVSLVGFSVLFSVGVSMMNGNLWNRGDGICRVKENLRLVIAGTFLIAAGIILWRGGLDRLVYFVILIGLIGVYFKVRERSVYSSFVKSMVAGVMILVGASFCCISANSFVMALLMASFLLGIEITWEITRGYEKYREFSIPAYFGEKDSGIIVGATMFICMLATILFSAISKGSITMYSVPSMVFAYCGYKMIIDAEKFAREVYLIQQSGFLILLMVLLYQWVSEIALGYG